MRAHDRFGVTVDILGKRDTFMLSMEGKGANPAFQGILEAGLAGPRNTESRSFTDEFQYS